MIDLNPSAFQRADDVRMIHEAVDRALVIKALRSARRTYLGASSIGAGCERRVQLEYLGTHPDADHEPEARTQRIFARGHVVEEMAIGWLRDAGYDVSTVSGNGSQHGFAALGGKFKGHCDGIIRSGPGIDAPCIWEHKAIGQKSWAAIAKHGMTKSKPEYADQIALYQAYMNLTTPALFQATNCDTMEIYFERVAFDAARAQAASDRAVAIIQDSEAGALRPRASDTSDFWLCKSCQFRQRCWG